MSHFALHTAQGRDKDKEEEEEREQMCDVWALIMTAMLAVTDHQKKFLESIEVTLLLNHYRLRQPLPFAPTAPADAAADAAARLPRTGLRALPTNPPSES